MKEGQPALITVDGDLVLVTHERFRGVIDPFANTTSLEGDAEIGRALLERTALGCRLPLEGGVLLHTAGAVIGGQAFLFFGVSGAGKSTISELLQQPLLSDELVAVRGGRASATGFWGTLDERDAPRGDYPIAALVELGRGEGVEISRLTPREAMRRLLLVTVVPPHPRLWSHALEVVARLAHGPVFRLCWTPNAENAQHVLAWIAGV